MVTTLREMLIFLKRFVPFPLAILILRKVGALESDRLFIVACGQQIAQGGGKATTTKAAFDPCLYLVNMKSEFQDHRQECLEGVDYR